MKNLRFLTAICFMFIIASACNNAGNSGIVLSRKSDSILRDTTPVNFIYDSLRTAYFSAGSDSVQFQILAELSARNKKVADPLTQDALSHARRTKDQKALTEALCERGNYFTRMSEFDSASKYLEESKALAQELGSAVLSARVNFRLGELYYQMDDNARAITEYENALKIAQGIQDKKWIAYSLSGIAESYRMVDENEKSLSYFNRAIKITRKIGDQSRTAFCLSSIGEVYRYTGDNDSALHYYNEALRIAESIKDKGLISFCLSTIASVYVTTNDYSKALNNYAEAIRIAKENNNKSRVSYCLSSMGELYRIQNDFPKALDYFNQALVIAEEMGDRSRMAFCYSSLGETYRVTGNFEKALELLNKALEIAKETEDRSRAGFCHNTIAETYFAMGDTAAKRGDRKLRDEHYRNGLARLDSALHIAEEIGDKIRMADCLGTKGEILGRKISSKTDPEFGEAVKALERSYELGKELENNTRISLSLGDLGWIYIKVNDPVMARVYAEKSLIAAKKSEAPVNILTAAEVLFNSYAKTGDYKKAFEMHQLFKAMGDSLTNVDNVKRFAATEYKAKEEKLNAERTKQEAVYKAEQIKQEAEIQKQRTVRNAFIAGFALVLILAFVIYRSLQQNRKARKLIEEQKRETEHQKHMVEEKNKEIIDSITYARRIQKSLLPTEKYIWDTLRRLQKPK